MTSETTRHETYQKDSYNFSFGMIGGRANNCNSHGHGKPSKPSRKRRKHYSVEGGTGHSNHDDDDDHGSNNHHVQSQPPQQQGVSLQTAPGGYAYPYQCPPPPYPNQLAVGGGGYHGHYNVVPAGYPYPAGSFVPPQGGYGNHGGAHIKDVGLVGAAIGVASFGMFKLLRERRKYGRG